MNPSRKPDIGQADAGQRLRRHHGFGTLAGAFFADLAKELNREYELVAITDWAGISVALANEQVDLAWMGPWGYVLANNDSGVVTAFATAK